MMCRLHESVYDTPWGYVLREAERNCFERLENSEFENILVKKIEPEKWMIFSLKNAICSKNDLKALFSDFKMQVVYFIE